MRKILSSVVAVAAVATMGISLASGAVCAAAQDNELSDGCKSAYLCDFASGECVYKRNENARMPIASVCKVMTLTLCFEAIERGEISADEYGRVSAQASGMGGSQVFLGEVREYSVNELMKSIAVCSANDSCVAMAERISGSEDVFVAEMNERAKELGCKDTLFANCTGLPKETQYSCAHDVAVMFSNLIKHKGYFDYSRIWLEDFKHPDERVTTMTNTNKLIKKYSLCDGGKTGYTGEAGFCLASTAVKDNMRLISVVLGGESSDIRFADTVNLFDYGFANYENKLILDANTNIQQRAQVKGGKRDCVSVCPLRSSYVFSAKNAQPEVSQNLVMETLRAPVHKGDKVGYAEIYKNGIITDTVELVAAEDIEKSCVWDDIRKVAGEWAL